MLNPIPRRYFGLSVVTLGIALCLAGCGGSSSSNDGGSSYDGHLDLGHLSSNQVATVALGYYPDVDDADPTSVYLSCKNANNNTAFKKVAANAKEEDSTVTRCGNIQLETEGRQAIAKYCAKCLSEGTSMVNSKVNDVYTTLAEGDTTKIKVVTSHKKNVVVQKMHANSDTDSVIVFAEVIDSVPVITKEKALQYDKIFGTKNPNDPDGLGIGKRVRDTFGSEWRNKGGKDGTDKLILMLLSQETLGRTGLYGYTYSVDSLSASENEYSNEGEIVYLNSEINDRDLYPTLAHEFQHLCDFNQKYIHDGTFANNDFELVSISEGKSVLAEDVTGYGLAPQGESTGKPGNYFIAKAINKYLQEPGSYSSYRFNNALGDYGKSYMTMRYIADLYGIEAIHKLATSSETGYANIEKVIGTSIIDLMNGVTVASTALKNLPSDMKYHNLVLDCNYDLYNEGEVETVYVRSVAGNEIKASDLGSTEVEIKPETSTVVDIIGDGSQVDLEYSLPVNCSGTVVISEDGKYVKSYTLHR